KDEVTGDDLTSEEKRLVSVYQFRRWQTDDNNHHAPVLGGYYGTPCELNFIANYQYDLKSDAYFIDDQESEKSIQRIFQQTLVKPSENLACEGYEFVGWKMKLEYIDNKIENNSLIKSYADIGKDDYNTEDQFNLKNDGTYDFSQPGKIAKDFYTFVAVWRIKTYQVTYYVKDENSQWTQFNNENVSFDGALKGFNENEQPDSMSGYVFAGWYLFDDLPKNGEDADLTKQWKFGLEGDRMPARNIDLYAGWSDNFNMLRALLENETYIEYNNHYLDYFEENSGKNYHDAYVVANTAKENNDNSNVDEIIDNLQTSYNALRINPKKLLSLPAFDDTLIQNTCPFLYDATFYYVSYETFKNRMQDDYINRTDEGILTNITGYISNYEMINRLFDELNNHLRSGVQNIESPEVTELIEKYQELETRYAALLEESSMYDMTALENAKDIANKYWGGTDKDLKLKEIEIAIANYESALNNLTLKAVDNESNNQSNNSGKTPKNSNSQTNKLGISPVILSVIIVSVLAAGVIVFIGVDLVLNKRHLGKIVSKGTSSEKTQKVPDEDTYV
ncbi:MAG: InlB B-repeat-containing protein, partial [Clostridia bacterium]|nr:InlB B-repeat-containing protein [Clostridia bacterium]